MSGPNHNQADQLTKQAPRHRVNGPGLADKLGVDMAQSTDPADQRWFEVDDDTADAFQSALDRPAQDKPRLRALLNARPDDDAGVSR